MINRTILYNRVKAVLRNGTENKLNYKFFLMDKNYCVVQRMKKMDSVLWTTNGPFGRRPKIKGLDSMKRQRRVVFVEIPF